MQLVQETSAQALLAEALPRFAPREVEYNMPLGVLKQLSNAPTPQEPPWLWSVRDGDQLIGVALRTPPSPVLLSGLPEDACRLIAEALLARNVWPIALNGPNETVERVGAELVRRASLTIELLYDQRLFQLSQVVPAPNTPGAMRLAVAEDAPLAVQFLDGFERDAVPEQVGTRDLQTVVAGMLAQRRLFLWQDGDSVGAMAAFNRRVGRGTSIGAVYAPPSLRRRGYATALVAALSQHMLDDGCAYTCLLTDLANPTSNNIYAKIGYQPVCDMRHVRVRPS